VERLPDLTRDETSWRREWQRYLPADYRRRTAVPIRFEREADLQAGGVRVMGFDRWGENCFYHHVYEVPAPIVDDEEGAFQETRCYGQSVFAWRLAGNWLVCTREHGAAGACRPERRHYALAATLPR